MTGKNIFILVFILTIFFVSGCAGVSRELEKRFPNMTLEREKRNLLY